MIFGQTLYQSLLMLKREGFSDLPFFLRSSLPSFVYALLLFFLLWLKIIFYYCSLFRKTLVRTFFRWRNFYLHFLPWSSGRMLTVNIVTQKVMQKAEIILSWNKNWNCLNFCCWSWFPSISCITGGISLAVVILTHSDLRQSIFRSHCAVPACITWTKIAWKTQHLSKIPPATNSSENII